MTSRLFRDLLVVLRVAPLVSSTCTLLYAWDQHFFLGIMNRPENRANSKPLLQSYFNTFFKRSLPFIISCIGASTWGGLGNFYVQRSALKATGAFWWYVAGSVLATSHLLFVPSIAPSIKKILENGDGTDVNESLDEWLGINARRMLTVDLAAWVAFAVAVVKSLRI